MEYKIIYIKGNEHKFSCEDHDYNAIKELYINKTPILLLIDDGHCKFYSVDYLLVPESANQFFVFEGQYPIYWGKDNIISDINPFKGEDDYARFHISRYEC